MADYSKYDVILENYQRKLPHYLQTPGSIIMNQIQLYYDIMKEYKDLMVDMWTHFDLQLLLAEYLLWRNNNPTLDDSEWKYTDLVEKLCKSYDIIREHPVGVLRNSHMLRLLKVKTLGVNFDGSKEKLEELLEAVFPRSGSIKFLAKTATNGIDHATADVYLIKSATDASFDTIDGDLFEGGYYFLRLLGITLRFLILDEDTLLYDNTSYDDSTEDDIEDENGNRYDKGGDL